MSNKISGVVEATARSNKAFKVGEEWYSVFKPAQASGAKKGDTVEFAFKPVVKGGQTFYNIEGNITVLGSPEPAANTEATDGRYSDKTYDRRGNGTSGVDGDAFRKRSMKYFPMPKDDVDRPIVRQNSLTQANAAMAAYYGGGQEAAGFTPDQYAEHVIEIARQFEAYASGEV